MPRGTRGLRAPPGARGVLLRPPPALAGGVPSVAQIEELLAEYNSPMVGKGAVFVREGRRYGVNPAFLVAIAGAETSFGRLLYSQHGDVCTYNAFNWFYGATRQQSDFASWDEAIARVAKGISGSLYYGSGLTSVPGISFRYCPVGTAEWLSNVTVFMERLGADPSETRLGFSSSAPRTKGAGVTLVDSVRVSPAQLAPDQYVKLHFVLTNAGKASVSLQGVRLVVRGPDGASADMISRGGFTLRPGESHALTASVTATLVGRWAGWVEVQQGGRTVRVGPAEAFSYRVTEVGR